LDPDAKILWLAPYQQTPKPIRTRVLAHWLYRQAEIVPENISYGLIARIDALAMKGEAGKAIQLSDNQRIRHIYDHLLMDVHLAPEQEHQPMMLPIPGQINVAPLLCEIRITESTGFDKTETGSIGALPASCFVRKPKNNEALFVRTRRSGDRIHMTGAGGSRKLQDIFTDMKVPAHQRDQIPIIASATQVVWVPGLRIHQDWAVPTKQSPSLHIEVRATATT
jgi:tRNA(Ile)-lysidine synthetase-like protein